MFDPPSNEWPGLAQQFQINGDVGPVQPVFGTLEPVHRNHRPMASPASSAVRNTAPSSKDRTEELHLPSCERWATKPGAMVDW